MASTFPAAWSLIETLRSIPPAAWCQAFLSVATAAVVAVAAAPASAGADLLTYGARAGAGEGNEKKREGASLVGRLTARGRVPHTWFIAFYMVSATCSVFWVMQYLTHGRILRYFASWQAGEPGPAMSLGQVAVAWGMLYLQAVRRIYEHTDVIAPSSSQMWVVHWLLGISFYVCMSVAVWVEGSASILDYMGRPSGSASYGVPVLKTAIGVAMFLFASLNQFLCHKYLASLRKYSLPKAGMFQSFVCPHYTCECLIYVSFVVAAAPEGSAYNRTLLCALVFVVANLGATAAGTRKWYIEKFGKDSVAARWNMIPFVF